MAPLAEARGAPSPVRGRDPEIRVVGDEERIRQVPLNLVGNAIEFTQEGDGSDGTVL